MKKATAGYITFTELPRFIHERTRKVLSRLASFLIPDNSHPYHNLFIDGAVLLAGVILRAVTIADFKKH